MLCSLARGLRYAGEGVRELGLYRLLLKLLWVMAFRMEVVMGCETSQASLTGHCVRSTLASVAESHALLALALLQPGSWLCWLAHG